MNSIKKIFALFLSCQMIVSFGNIINIEATESFEDFDSINGVPPLTIEEYNEICENIETSTESEYSTYVSYPSTVDYWYSWSEETFSDSGKQYNSRYNKLR